MKILKLLFKNYSKTILFGLILCIFMFGGRVYASHITRPANLRGFDENTQGVPASIVDKITRTATTAEENAENSTGDASLAPDGGHDCAKVGTDLLNAQFYWISPVSDQTNEGAISVTYGSDTLNLWLNTTVGSCDGDILSGGVRYYYTNHVATSPPQFDRVNYQGLLTTYSTFLGATVGSSPAAGGLSISGLSSGFISDNVKQTYQYKRWAKETNSTLPAHRQFTISGLSQLQPNTAYQLTLTARIQQQNTFSNGQTLCVRTGCAESVVTRTITIVTTPSQNPICTLTPNPGIINSGGSSTLSWTTQNATSISISPNVGSTTSLPNGSVPVTPTSNTTYTATVTGAGGQTSTCTTNITVSNEPAFTCQPVFYQVSDGLLDILDPNTGSRNPIGDTGKSRMNAMGYNVLDDYLYAIEREAGSGSVYLSKIAADGSATRLTNAGDIPGVPDYLTAGDMDINGNLWYVPDYRVTSIVRLNVATKVATTYTMDKLVNSSDIVFSGGFLYGLRTGANDMELNIINTNPNGLGQIDVQRKEVTGNLPGNSEFTSGWTTISGSLYFYQRTTGDIFRIDDKNGSPVSTLILDSSVGDSFGSTDGASCPNAKDPLTKINYPFLKVNGSDVIAGAKFSIGDICSNPNTADPFGTIKTNGFKTHGYNSSNTSDIDILSGSSSAEYAAFAFSKIYSSGGSSSFLANNGYYRDIGSNKYARDLMFANATANQPSGEYGNFNTEGTLPCLNISQIEKSATDVSASVALDAIKLGTTTQVLRVKSGDLDITSNGPGISIAKGRRVTVIVDNAVTINTNIVFDNSSSSDGVINSPQLTIIAKNGIIIKDSVTRLDGYYDAHNSTLKTCDISASPSTGVCNKQLIVNGGLVGKKIEWRRNYGTLNSDLTTLAMPDNSRCSVETKANGDVSNVISAQNECAAEKIDFDPLFYFNNPFSLKPGQSTISGAPLNSVELPPIY